MIVRIGSWLIAILISLTGWASAQVPSEAPRGAPIPEKVPSAAVTKTSALKLLEAIEQKRQVVSKYRMKSAWN